MNQFWANFLFNWLLIGSWAVWQLDKHPHQYRYRQDGKLYHYEGVIHDRPRTAGLADADQLSALVILANYGREGMENAIVSWAAGCQTIGILPNREAKSAKPRAVVGLTDISARKYVRTLLGSEYLSFAMPWEMFLEMERDVAGSFLEMHTWRSLLE